MLLAGSGPTDYDFTKQDQPREYLPDSRASGDPRLSEWENICIVSWKEGSPVARLLQQLWNDDNGQDIAEYAVMLAVILVIVVGTIRLIGSNANNVFSQVGSAIQ